MCRFLLGSCSVTRGLRPDPARIPSPSIRLCIEAGQMDTHRFGMAVQLSRDLLGWLAGPTLQHHLGMNLPIGWGMIAPGQFTDLALFFFILVRYPAFPPFAR